MVKKAEFSTCDLKDQFPKSTFQSLENFFSYGGIKKFYGQAVLWLKKLSERMDQTRF